MHFFKSSPAFRPIPQPLPPRKSCVGICIQQAESSFFTKLPPEVRNEIYRYAFSLDALEFMIAKHHPLSLLLTCHKVNHEATNLAFYTYAFAIASSLQTTFVSLRNKTSHLSSQQIFAITALSYDLGKEYLHRNIEVANVITNGILVFPSLSRFGIYVQRGHKIEPEERCSPLPIGQSLNDPRKDAVEKYVPGWFDYNILRAIANGNTFSWQVGQKWTVEWPQFDTPYFSVIECEDVHGELFKKPYMGSEAVGAVRGVHMCVCGCGEVCWLSASLVQQTGRRILVETLFYGAEEFPKSIEERHSHLKIWLRPGVEPLPVIEGPTWENAGTTSLAYEVDEEYWEEVRRRNGKWDAVLRRAWKWCWKVCEGKMDR